MTPEEFIAFRKQACAAPKDIEAALEACDPLSTHVAEPLRLQLAAYQEASGEEELSYRLDVAEVQKEAAVNLATTKMQLAAELATHLLGYTKARIDLWEWKNDDVAQGALVGLAASKQATLNTLQVIKDELGMSFDDVMANESMKIWMLNPQAVDALGRIKTALSPDNYEAYRDMVKNEILAGLSLEEIALREPHALVSFALDKTHDAFQTEAQRFAADLNAQLPYFHATTL